MYGEVIDPQEVVVNCFFMSLPLEPREGDGGSD